MAMGVTIHKHRISNKYTKILLFAVPDAIITQPLILEQNLTQRIAPLVNLLLHIFYMLIYTSAYSNQIFFSMFMTRGLKSAYSH